MLEQRTFTTSVPAFKKLATAMSSEEEDEPSVLETLGDEPPEDAKNVAQDQRGESKQGHLCGFVAWVMLVAVAGAFLTAVTIHPHRVAENLGLIQRDADLE